MSVLKTDLVISESRNNSESRSACNRHRGHIGSENSMDLKPVNITRRRGTMINTTDFHTFS